MNDNMTNLPGGSGPDELDEIDFSREAALFRAAFDRHDHRQRHDRPSLLPPRRGDAAAKRAKPVLVATLMSFGEGSTGEAGLPKNSVAARLSSGFVVVHRSDLSPMTEAERAQARAIAGTASSWTTNQDGCRRPVRWESCSSRGPRPGIWPPPRSAR